MNDFSSSRAGTRTAVQRTHSNRGYASSRSRGHTGSRRTTARQGLPAPRLSDSAADGARESAEETGRFATALRASLFALPVTAVLGLIFLLVAAGVAYANPDPDRLITPLGLCALALTALCGGFVSARRGRVAPALCGLLLGILLTLLLFGVSLLLRDSTRSALTLGLSGPASFGLHAGVVVLALLGAIIGRRR